MPGPNIGLTYDPVSFLVGFTASIGPQPTASGDYDEMAIDACVNATNCYPLVATSIWQQIKDSAAEFLAAEQEHISFHSGDDDFPKHVKEAEHTTHVVKCPLCGLDKPSEQFFSLSSRGTVCKECYGANSPDNAS